MTRHRSEWLTGAQRPGRVLRLVDVCRADIDAMVAEIVDDRPVILTYCGSAPASSRAVVGEILDELEQIVIALAPAWLGGDEPLARTIDVDDAEMRARALCAAGADYRPFVIDLARAAATGTGTALRAGPAPETRARGLTRLLRRAYARESVVLAVTVPPDLDGAAESVVATAVGWIAEHGDVTVWLPADTLPHLTRCSPVRGPIRTHPAVAEPRPEPPAAITISRCEGMPAPHSDAEQALERALNRHAWAVERRWNRRIHDLDPMLPMAIADIHWPDERVIVEVDGDDHRQPAKYAADRARDNMLQRHGYLVLRYTNRQVLADVGVVVDEIHDALAERATSGTRPIPATTSRSH